jgi:exopolysaccharide biosynthesis polyprenyl glycosylphosphotransferase
VLCATVWTNLRSVAVEEQRRNSHLRSSAPPTAATIAIVHDYLTQRGGAERVVLSLARAFPGAPIHTSMYEPTGTFPEFADLPISTSSLDHLSAFRQHHRAALPLLARSFSKKRIGADVVVCSSSGWAHGVQTDGRKVVYCHNPARWLYQADRYEPGHRGISGIGLSLLQRPLRRWDFSAAQSAHRYLANSTVVRDRIRDAYGIDAEVVPPPFTVDVNGPQQPVDGVDSGFFLCVSRLISYKNVAAIVGAMQGLGEHRLVVVGTGPEADALRVAAPSNVAMVGSVTDDQLRWLYANCVGLVSASYEDFGLTPIEAAAFGKPAALLRWGGFLDTLHEGVSGVFFDEASPVSAGEAMQRLAQEPWDETAIRAHADQYREERFIERLRGIVSEEALVVGRSVALLPPHSEPAVGDRLSDEPAALELALVAAQPSAIRAAPAVSALRGLSTKAVVVASDLASVSVAMLAAFAMWARWRSPDPAYYLSAHAWLGLLSLPVWLLALANAGLYRSRLVTSRMEETRRLARAATLSTLGIAAVSTVTRLNAARLWLVLTFVLGFGFLFVSRSLVRAWFLQRRRRGLRQRGVVVVGMNDEAIALARSLHDDPALGYRVLGFMSDDLPSDHDVDGIAPVLGGIDQTLSAVRRLNATGVLIATSAVSQAASSRLTGELADVGVHVELSSSLRDIALRRMTIRPVGRYPILYIEPMTRGSWRSIAKRLFDLTLASIGLILCVPVLAVAAIAIRLDSPGPVFFRQRRVGRGGVTFEVIKLRTMVQDAEQRIDEVAELNEASWPLFKMRKDPRVTRVGRFLRRTSIDELPQIWNVIRGSMSIVGPRPALASEMRGWPPDMHARLKVRPGITGMWQVNGRSSTSSEDYERLDLYYVNNWSLLTDVAIILRTIPAVLATRGAY